MKTHKKKAEVKKPAPKKCEHVLENPNVIRLSHAIYERGVCKECGAYGQYVTSGSPEKTIWEDM